MNISDGQRFFRLDLDTAASELVAVQFELLLDSRGDAQHYRRILIVRCVQPFIGLALIPTHDLTATLEARQ
ncbi:hypothetical protein D3C80_1593620 [compost metagenome]